MFKTILIGFGKIGAGYAKDKLMRNSIKYSTHIQVLQDHPCFVLEAVVDKDLLSLKEAKDLWFVDKAVQDISLIENPEEFDVAVIAIPPNDRLEVIKKFPNLRAIILEKPVADNIIEARKILQYCRKNEILVQVNFGRRFDKKILKHLKNLTKDIGKIQSAFGLYGNGLKNNGSHLIDWARMFLGEVSWVQSLGNGNFIEEGPILNDKNFPFVMGFKSKVLLMVQPLKFKKYRENSLDFWGENGRLFFPQEGLISLLYKKKNHRFSENDYEIENDIQISDLMDQSKSLYNLYTNLSDTIFSRSKLYSSINNAIITMKIIDSLEASFINKDEKIFLNV